MSAPVAWATLAAWLLPAGGGLVHAQAGAADGSITVISPTEDDTFRAGASITVEFNTTGAGVSGPYDINLWKGIKQVHSWCDERRNCEVDLGTVPVVIPSTSVPGLGYTVRVTDRNSSISGSSLPFEVLARLTNSSDVVIEPRYTDNVGGAAEVGDMSVAMLVMAAVCVVAVVGSALVACCLLLFRCRRPADEAKKVQAEQGYELGGDALASSNTGELYDSSPDSRQGYRVGNPLKSSSAAGSNLSRSELHVSQSGRSQRSQGLLVHGASPARSASNSFDSQLNQNPRQAIAPGLSRSSSSPGIRMYSNTPGRSLRSRGAMVASASPMSGSQAFVSTPGRIGGSDAASASPARGSSSGAVVVGDPRWDGSGEGDKTGPRSPSKIPGVAAARPRSTGRLPNRPPKPISQQSAPVDFISPADGRRERWTTMTPGRRLSSDNVKGYDREELPPAALGIRRSKSDRHFDSAKSLDGLAGRELEEVGAGRSGGGFSRWEGRDLVNAWEQEEEEGQAKMGRGFKSERSSLSGSMNSRSMYSYQDHDVSASDSYSSDHRDTHSGRQGSNIGMDYGAAEPPTDVSWEELRSTYLKTQTRLKTTKRTPKSTGLPSYANAVQADGDPTSASPHYDPGDAGNAQDVSMGVSHEPLPGKGYFRSDSKGNLRLSGRRPPPSAGGSGQWSRTSSKSPGRRLVSPATRAVDARRAARDAQLSAERALAAAATASRAADLAAQAAFEAEAEADAELAGHDSADEVDMDPPSRSSSRDSDLERQRSSIREKIKAFDNSASASISARELSNGRAARTRGWTQSEEREVKARAQQSSVKAKEVLVLMERSNSGVSGNTDNSWVKNVVRGPDTAGGSSGESAVVAVAPTAAAAMDAKKQQFASRRAFVSQYSQSGVSDFTEDSDFSLHDGAAVAALMARPGANALHYAGVAGAAATGHTTEDEDAQLFTDDGKGTPTRS